MTPERLLGAEVLAAWTLQVGSALNGGAMPEPVQLAGGMIAYGMLAVGAMFSPSFGRLAGALGGVLLLVVAMAPPHPSKPVGRGNEPLLVRFFGWLRTWPTTAGALPAGTGAKAAYPKGSGGSVLSGPLGASTGPLPSQNQVFVGFGTLKP